MSSKDAIQLTQIEPQPNYRLRLTYADGVTGVVDLSRLVGKGVFRLWEDPVAFQRVSIGSGGEVHWSENVDLCADAIYLQIASKTVGDIFPSLASKRPHA
jgi:hypothetical protein